MNKRKASTDRNANQKASARRPSASSLHARMNMMQQMQSRPEKSPSTQNVPCLEHTDTVNRTIDACIPKTRFTSQDRSRDMRSCSSPRLKSFPAEKIKKLETPPPFAPEPIGALIVQQNPREGGTLYVGGSNEIQNNGQGDVGAAVQPLHQQRPQQNLQTASHQQVAPHRAIHQISEMSPNSECTLPQQVLNSQAHRPFVPHGTREYSPQNNAPSGYNPHSLFRNSPQTTAIRHPFVQQSSSNAGQDQERAKAENNAAECPNYDKQPVGGRNATMYRQQTTNNQSGHLQSQISMAPNMSNLSNGNHQQLSAQNLHSTQGYVSPVVNPQNPQQVYQQMQQTLAQQQQMQQRAMYYQMRMMNNQQQMQGSPGSVNLYRNQQLNAQTPSQSMTSPQDATMNQVRASRMAAPGQQNYQMHRDLDYTMSPQNGWPKDNQVTQYSSIKAQLQPYSVDVANQPHFATQNQQQFIPQYQQELVHQRQQLYRNPMHGDIMNQGQQNSIIYGQTGFDPQAHPSQQPAAPNPRPPVNNPVRQSTGGGKPKLPFTVRMIRDQEKLVATMKQQKVPMDVMRRQFDILLAEQRKQLEHIEELRRQDESGDVKRPVATPRRRKQVDEKPEWMIHLTPPRLSYIELEKMQEEQKQRDRQARQYEESRQAHQMVEMQNPQHPTGQQGQFYQQPSLQHQNRVPQAYNNMYNQDNAIPGNVNTNEPAKPNPNPSTVNYQYYSPQQSVPSYQQTQYPYQHQQNPQFQQYQQVYQASQQQNQDHVHSTNIPSSYEDNIQPEPSSLLKMRLYKEQVQPQKRNNGLQDPQVLRKQMETVQMSEDVRKGLEYLASLVSKKPPVRLNGIQDRSEIEEELKERLLMSAQEPPKQVSANGLENTRNPNNPPLQRYSNPNKTECDFLREYPRQKVSNPRNCYSVQAERENGAVATDQQPPFVQQQLPGHSSINVIPYNEKNPTMARGNVMPFRFENVYPQHYQQMQQYYQNTRNLARNNGEGDVGSAQRIDAHGKASFDRAGGDACANSNNQMDRQMAEGKMPFQGMQSSQPDIHETRTIGGVRYLARKQGYIPNTQFVSPDTLIASRHLQPPMMY
ncbi:putative uncharacterized protein DDB_G0271606 [Hylaeus volcanicus]|uniref:putative uncharacterized protein DDB_G0271606 n=1 Tax=Hylaeus volcanicus TaxID=313075 RepID=UPI0023B7E85D|nr:putative uncharacterized protein DDB_G0271606 [Hylaeus volcanicus]XP_053973332.1 putative uncharacterized protein DDB_G0271606 [Hylaeus volcanicus]XP_053973333.1 putative uncharacterized protein DDB_G0271606 [Hylaeus volcanicus]